MSSDSGTIVSELRRELRADAQFRKLSQEDQTWLVESIAAGNYGTLAQLAAALKSRSSVEFGKSALAEFKGQVNSRLLKIEGARRAQRELSDRLIAGAAKASEVQSLAERMLPGITKGVAAVLGDQALNLVMSKGDPEEVGPALKQFLEAAEGVRRDQSVALKREELQFDRQRHQENAVEQFVKWHADQRAREILESPRSNAERIKALGELFYADLWQPATPAPANG